MGHEVSQEAPMDPDLEAENLLLELVPTLMDELLWGVAGRQGSVTHTQKL